MSTMTLYRLVLKGQARVHSKDDSCAEQKTRMPRRRLVRTLGRPRRPTLEAAERLLRARARRRYEAAVNRSTNSGTSASHTRTWPTTADGRLSSSSKIDIG